jgi:hypothetical protein
MGQVPYRLYVRISECQFIKLSPCRPATYPDQVMKPAGILDSFLVLRVYSLVLLLLYFIFMNNLLLKCTFSAY